MANNFTRRLRSGFFEIRCFVGAWLATPANSKLHTTGVACQAPATQAGSAATTTRVAKENDETRNCRWQFD